MISVQAVSSLEDFMKNLVPKHKSVSSRHIIEGQRLSQRCVIWPAHAQFNGF